MCTVYQLAETYGLANSCITYIYAQSTSCALMVCSGEKLCAYYAFVNHSCYSLPLIWHVWSRKKMLYYLNVVLCMIWYFGLKCCIIEVFQENGIFQCKMSFCRHNEDTWVWKNILYWKIMLTMSHNMELRKVCTLMMMFSSTKSSLLNCTYSSISTSRLPRFTNEMRLANSFVVSFTIKFLCTTSTTKLAF